MKLPTVEYLNKRFKYDETTGNLIWKAGFGKSSKHAGKIAGSLFKNSGGKTYRRVKLDQKEYLVHRLIFKMFYGFDPVEVDHDDGDGTNNLITNLVHVDHPTNQKNMKLRLDNKSGTTGVSWSLTRKMWRARITINQVEINLGYFHTKQEAIECRMKANIDFKFNKNHGSKRPL